MNKKIIFVGLVCIFALIVAGCVEKTPVEEKKTITVTDLAGREVAVKVPVEKVILQGSGSGGGFLTILALEGENAPKKIAGWDPGLKEYRHWIWKKFSEALPELDNIPDVGRISKATFSVEKVTSLKPDVVILPLYSYHGSKDIVDKLESAGIPVVVIDYHTETLENHVKSILLVGKLLGREERAKELADFYKEEVNKVYSRLKEISKPKPKVYVEIGSKAWGNTYGNYMWGALVKKCGGINIAEGKVERWGPINPEYILKENPDVVVITGSYWPKYPDSVKLGYYAHITESRELLRKYVDRPGWENLNAIRNERVYSIHHGLSRNIWDFAAIQFLAKCFYPDEFKDLNPEESLKKFHEKFLPVDYSGVWMMSLKEKRKTVMITDLAGRQVAVKMPAERVVITGYFAFDLLPLMGKEDFFERVVGWTRDSYVMNRHWFWQKWIESGLPVEEIPDVGYVYKRTFSVEKVIELNPDVVIMALWEQEYAAEDVKKLESAGIPVVVVDFWKKPEENTIKSIQLLGKILGKEERAKELASFYKEQLDKVYSRLGEIKEREKPNVYMESGYQKWKAYGNVGHGIWIGKAGGINIAKELVGERTGEISPEYLLKENPDVIITSGSYWPKRNESVWLGYYANETLARERLKNWIDRPGWEELKAVKNKRVYVIHHALQNHIWDFVELQYFAKWLYPDVFENLDPEENFKEFHERFMPFIDYSGVWAISLEEE